MNQQLIESSPVRWYRNKKKDYFLVFNVFIAVCALSNHLFNQFTGSGITTLTHYLTTVVIVGDLLTAAFIYFKKRSIKPLLVITVLALAFLIPMRWALVVDRLSISFYWGLIACVCFALFLETKVSVSLSAVSLSAAMLAVFTYYKLSQINGQNYHSIFTPAICTAIVVGSIFFMNYLTLKLLQEYSTTKKAILVGAYTEMLEQEEKKEQDLTLAKLEIQGLEEELESLRNSNVVRLQFPKKSS